MRFHISESYSLTNGVTISGICGEEDVSQLISLLNEKGDAVLRSKFFRGVPTSSFHRSTALTRHYFFAVSETSEMFSSCSAALNGKWGRRIGGRGMDEGVRGGIRKERN